MAFQLLNTPHNIWEREGQQIAKAEVSQKRSLWSLVVGIEGAQISGSISTVLSVPPWGLLLLINRAIKCEGQ